VIFALVCLSAFCAPADDSVVVFNEIMYHPAINEAELEWVELCNQMSVDIELSGWSIRGGIEYDFAEGTVIPGRGYLVVALSPAALEAATGLTNSVGPFLGRLANTGEELRLRNNNQQLMNVVEYRDGGDWPVAPDGSGVSLAKSRSQSSSAVPGNWSWSAQSGGTPGQVNQAVSPNGLALNEISSAAATNFQVELVNYGDQAINLNGYALESSGVVTGFYAFPSQTMNPGDYLVVDESTLGFEPLDEHKLFLRTPVATNAVIDAAVVKISHRGKSPEGTGRWLYPDAETWGTANSFTFHDDIVINEIMYHHPPGYEPYLENPEEWIELYNGGGAGVDLSGWKLEEGIDYTFEPGTTLGVGQYLVVAKDSALMAAKYPAINIVGDYSRSLSNRGDLIRLVDAQKNPADEVFYRDGTPWAKNADGGGSSLELRDHRADNSVPEAWAASLVTNSTWSNYSYTMTAANPIYNPNISYFHELRVGLLNWGECLIDNVTVVEDPNGASLQLIQNPTFESDPIGGGSNKWRLRGTHSTSTVAIDPDDPSNQAMNMVASAHTYYLNNRLETTLKDAIGFHPVVQGKQYQISFDAKWLGGSPQVYTELYCKKVVKTTILDMPDRFGSPGGQNSTFESNIGPTYKDLMHSPVVPAAGENITVSVAVADPNGIGTVSLWYNVDQGGWAAVGMPLQGDGLYAGVIPGQSATSIIQFFVQGSDSSGAGASCPAAGSNSRALIKIDDGLAVPEKHNVRLILRDSDSEIMHEWYNLLSNQRLGATVVYNEEEVFYDAQVRLRGSGATRDDHQTGYNIQFPHDKPFRGVQQTVNLMGCHGAFDRPHVREIVCWHVINRAGGVPGLQGDMVNIIAHRKAARFASDTDNGTTLMFMARFNNVYLDSLFENGSDGTMFKMEGIREITQAEGGNPEGRKDGVSGVGFIQSYDIRDMGNDKEQYRFGFRINNNRARDDYSGFIAMAKVFSLTGTALEQAVPGVMDVDEWMRAFPMINLVSAVDNYDWYSHNFNMYARPGDGKVLAIPFDLDFSWWGAAPAAPTAPFWNSGRNLAKIIERPIYKRLFYGHLRDILTTTYNTAYMTRWVNHYAGLAGENLSSMPPHGSSILNIVSVRGAHAWSQINSNAPFIPFEITSNGGAGFSVNDDQVTLAGNGWIDVRQFRLQGQNDPIPATWTGFNTWEITLPIDPGSNLLILEVYDHQNNLITSDTITVTSTVSERPLPDYLRVTEVMYNPAGGTPLRDREFIEFCNIGPVSLDLNPVVISNGIDFVFAGSSVTNLGPGEYVVVVKDVAEFSSMYDTNGMLIAGPYSGRLSNGGEGIILRGELNEVLIAFDYSDGRGWPLAADGAGHSLVPLDSAIPGEVDGSLYHGANWRQSAFLDGSPGEADPDPIVDILLNEIMAHTDGPLPWDSDDWIELYNTRSTNISTSGGTWYLSDDADNLTNWAIPPAVVIPGNGFITFSETNDFHNPITSGFGIDKAGEQVFLTYLPPVGKGRVADAVAFKGQENNVSLGRYPDGDPDWYPLALTPNAANALPSSHVVINEIMYHPLPTLANPEDNTNDEYIELYNPTENLVTFENAVGTWRIDGGVEYNFPANTTLGADGYLVIVPFDPLTDVVARTAFLDSYVLANGQVTMLGPYSGKLSNRGERIALERPQAPEPPSGTISWVIVDEVIYFHQVPWTLDPDGSGLPLQRNQTTTSGNNPGSWVVGVAATPGLPPVKVAITSPLHNTGFLVPFETTIRAVVTNVVGVVQYVEFFEGSNSLGQDNSTPYEYVLNTLTNEGDYTLTATMADDTGTNTSPSVSISVYTNAPIGDAGKDQTINIVHPVNLDSSVDYRGFPTGQVTTTWAKFSGPGSVTFGDATAQDTTAGFSVGGVYVLSLTTTFVQPGLKDFVTITVISSNSLNRIPYRESFESHVDGAGMVGIKGWYSEDVDSAVVVESDYTNTYAGTHPIPEEPHELVLSVDGTVTNKFENTAAHDNIWIDVVLESKTWIQAQPPQVEAGVQFGVYVNTNNHLVAWHCPDPLGAPTVNAWTELAETDVVPDEWIRLTLEVDYQRDINDFFYFRLWTNGVAITNTYEWFATANTNDNFFSGLSTLGEFHFDDMVVEDYDTLSFRKIAASAGLYGTIDPSGDVLVNIGGGTNFSMIASNYYHVDDVMIDGSESQGAINNYAFSNVTENHTIDASFSADLASHETPVWWLVQHGLGTNEADVIADGDGDWSLTWQEYVAGTDPTQSTSRFHIVITDASANVLVSYSTIGADGAGYEEVDRYYDLQESPDPLTGTWQAVPGFTNLVGDGGTVTYTNDLSNPPGFYRVKTWLQ
jgi:hypothetical protein